MKNADMPANACGVDQDHHNPGQSPAFAGLSKREHFAGLAMQALISGQMASGEDYPIRENVSANAVAYADAILAELEKQK